MFSYDLLIPWITLAATLVPLLYVQRWIHRHVFGVGYLISREKRAATLFYYLFLLPGVVLHELSAYLMAGVFNIPSTRFTIYPEAQEDGSLETGFVQLEEVKNPVFAAFIGIAPLLTGMLVVVVISNSLLDLPGFLAQLQTGDLSKFGPAIQTLVTKPDFLLWTYILFAVANAMMPNAEDRRGWWFVGSAVVGLLAFMSILGLGKFVVEWLAGPLSNALYSLSAVFGVVLGLDCLAMFGIWIFERALERVTGHRVEYQPTKALTAPQAPRKAVRSVYELNLPLPPLPGKITANPVPRLPPATERPAIGAGSPVRPAIPATSGQPASPAPARPALGSGSTERPAPAALPSRPAAGSASALAGSRPAGTSPTPFGQSPKPAAASSADQTGKPAAPGGQPARPAPASGQPARPGAPFGQPARPAASADQTGKPAAPGGQPARPAPPSGQPARPGAPFGQPARPAASADQTGKPAAPGGQPARPAPPSGQPARPGTPFGQPARPAAASADQTGKPAAPGGQPARPAPPSGQPARPGAPFGQPPKPGSSEGDTEKLGATSRQSAKPGTPFGQPPKSPISGPPALVRPGGPAGSKPQAPAKPPLGAPPRPGDSSRSRFGSFDKDSDDVIDADVIDEDEEEEEPGFMRGVNKPSSASQSRSPFGSRPQDKRGNENKDDSDDEDDDAPKYVDIDDL